MSGCSCTHVSCLLAVSCVLVSVISWLIHQTVVGGGSARSAVSIIESSAYPEDIVDLCAHPALAGAHRSKDHLPCKRFAPTIISCTCYTLQRSRARKLATTPKVLRLGRRRHQTARTPSRISCIALHWIDWIFRLSGSGHQGVYHWVDCYLRHPSPQFWGCSGKSCCCSYDAESGRSIRAELRIAWLGRRFGRRFAAGASA